MDNRKEYVSAEMKFIELKESDVIRTSGDVLPGINLPDIELSTIYGNGFNIID